VSPGIFAGLRGALPGGPVPSARSAPRNEGGEKRTRREETMTPRVRDSQRRGLEVGSPALFGVW
jgi:hypothetical protein